MENLDWMSVAKVLLLAWKLRMQLSKKQEKTRKSRGRSFLLTMNSLVWSVRWQLSNLESTTKEKTHGNYRTSTSYHWETQTGSDEKRSTSDSSLHSEDRVLQPENEKERDSGDRTLQAQEERERNRSVKLQRAIVFIGKYTTLRSRDRGSNPLSSPRLLKFV